MNEEFVWIAGRGGWAVNSRATKDEKYKREKKKAG